MLVSVWWKAKSYSWGIYTSHIHWVTWGTGTPKDRNEVNKQEVCECDGWVCDLDVTGSPLIFKIIRNATTLARMLPTFDFRCEEKGVWWKWNGPLVDCANWTPEDTKKRSVSRWTCKNRRHTNSLCNIPDVLIAGIKEITLGGLETRKFQERLPITEEVRGCMKKIQISEGKRPIDRQRT